ncbi:MAG: RNA polymerase factor sigma-54 [Candidatus Omnitrophica bacterium]|nr:RNA polymerase factor sigma-54 [Candidatus Omnitrophota bacterium]MBU1996881.1 RNA polymerase factor sigma-54 [Candidatus Omnitrophota bacterium]MBU4333141.1 RNA polymerase factor sigma-54 [Candidatus Omnitrophota bacterium]
MIIKISQSQVQKTILSPSMQQSIEVLLLPSIELETAIEQELQNNPLLEIDTKKTEEENGSLEALIDLNMRRLQENKSTPSSAVSNNNDLNDDTEETHITRTTPLEDYLLQQLRIELTDPQELLIGEFIIGNLDNDGYFKSTCEEIADILGIKDIDLVKQILHTIQNFEPQGIASRDLKECLLIQSHYKFNGDSELINEIIINHLENLSLKNYQKIARKLKISCKKVEELAKCITSLEPKPARKYRPVDENIYVKPDVTIIEDENNNFHIQITRDNIPCLRINSFYQNMLKQPNRTQEETDFIRENIKNAILFIKSIEQRNSTLKSISQYILEHQKDFFKEGTTSIRPMLLKDVAVSLDRNESTISRAISNKYIDTPQGLFSMKFFFSNGFSKNKDNESVSSRSLKEEIKQLIDQEDKSNPLSDQDIQLHFEKNKTPVARRTINKYRKSLRILPSYLRKA